MRREKTVLIGDLFSEFLKQNGLENGIERVEVYDALRLAIGEKNYALIVSKFYDSGRLFCTLSSAVLRSTLYMHRIAIIDKINKELGRSVVKELIIR